MAFLDNFRSFYENHTCPLFSFIFHSLIHATQNKKYVVEVLPRRHMFAVTEMDAHDECAARIYVIVSSVGELVSPPKNICLTKMAHAAGW